MHNFGGVFHQSPQGDIDARSFFFFCEVVQADPPSPPSPPPLVALRPWLLVFLAHLGAVNKFMAQRGNYAQTFCIRPNGRGP